MNPSPLPTPIDVAVDPNRVTPGLLGFLAFASLILAVVVLYLSMRKQLARIDFDDDALPAGVHALPSYATKAARRKSAAQYDAAVAEAAASRQTSAGMPPEPAADSTDGGPAGTRSGPFSP